MIRLSEVVSLGGSMGRAEVLAAVALVVGARQEPVSGFRRLAAEDPALKRLETLARQCSAGVALPDALLACRLISRADAGKLAGLPPDPLAAELTRLAQHAAWPPLGEVLARWFPLWAVLAATVPSLAIGAVVSLISSALYGGIWHTLGLTTPTHGLPLWWFVQVGEVVLAALLVTGCWWFFQRTPFIRRLTTFSPPLARAAAAAELIRSARAGADTGSALHTWTRLSGDPAAVRAAHATSGGDVTTTLMSLGVVPRRSDGGPDWDASLAEADRTRTQAAQTLAPWLIAVLVMTGIDGFLTWEMRPMAELSGGFDGYFSSQFANNLYTKHIVFLAMAACWAVVAMHVLVALRSLRQRLRGPASDWPMVADRVARALDRREDLDQVLRGLRLTVGRPMRRRLEVALKLPAETHPGTRLAQAGVVPRSLARGLSAADAADLPMLLRSASEVRDDHGLHAATSQVSTVLVLTLVLGSIQAYLLKGIIPRFKMMFDSMHQNYFEIASLTLWAVSISACTVGGIIFVGMVAAWGDRRGWWIAGGGWSRLACGLVGRRMLAAGSDESAIARALSALAPRRAARLTGAGNQGDLRGVLAAAGWPVGSAGALDQALTADLHRRDRRRARIALSARLLFPFLVGLPVGLTAVAINLSFVTIEKSVLDIASGKGQSTPGMSGGTPGMALIFWWSTRCEAQGDAVVEDMRAEKAAQQVLQKEPSPNHSAEPTPPSVTP